MSLLEIAPFIDNTDQTVLECVEDDFDIIIAQDIQINSNCCFGISDIDETRFIARMKEKEKRKIRNNAMSCMDIKYKCAYKTEYFPPIRHLGNLVSKEWTHENNWKLSFSNEPQVYLRYSNNTMFYKLSNMHITNPFRRNT